MSRIAYFNGAWVPESELKISAWDLATMQGASCFEMCRSFRHQHFKLREHLDRLRHSCELVSLPLPDDFEKLDRICSDVTERNFLPSHQEHRLLIVVNAGAAPMYREIEGVIPHSYCYVATFPLRYTVQGFSKYFLEGVHCVTSKVQQVPDACVPSAAKHRSRLHFHLAQQQAPPGTWPLLCDDDDYYTEAPGANLVYVDDQGAVCTIDENCLPGISLATVKDLVHTESGPFNRYAMRDVCRELWLTGTPFCALPVVSLDGQPIGDGQIGPKYQELMQKWNELVGLDIIGQICEWDREAAKVT